MYICIAIHACSDDDHLTLVSLSNVNFDGSLTAMGLVLRVTTGEDWHHLLWDSMVCTTSPYLLIFLCARHMYSYRDIISHTL